MSLLVPSTRIISFRLMVHSQALTSATACLPAHSHRATGMSQYFGRSKGATQPLQLTVMTAAPWHAYRLLMAAALAPLAAAPADAGWSFASHNGGDSNEQRGPGPTL